MPDLIWLATLIYENSSSLSELTVSVFIEHYILFCLPRLKKSFNKLCAGTQWRAPQFRSFRLPRSETPQDATVELWVGSLAQGGQIDSAQPREWRKNGAHVPDQCAALRLGHCRLFYWKLLRDVCIIATDPALFSMKVVSVWHRARREVRYGLW